MAMFKLYETWENYPPGQDCCAPDAEFKSGMLSSLTIIVGSAHVGITSAQSSIWMLILSLSSFCFTSTINTAVMSINLFLISENVLRTSFIEYLIKTHASKLLNYCLSNSNQLEFNNPQSL